MSIYELFPEAEKLPLFSTASTSNVNKYLTENNMEIHLFSHGEIIYSPMLKNVSVGIILDGKAHVHPFGADEKTLLKTMHKGDIFGIANLYAEDYRFPSVIISEKHTKVLFIDGDAFKRFIENDPAALKYYLRFLSQKIVYLNKKISTFTAGSAECKLALYIAENSDGKTFHSSLPMSDLAKTLGLGRASLYRALDKLIASNLINRDGMDIHITDKEGLLALASGDITQF